MNSDIVLPSTAVSNKPARFLAQLAPELIKAMPDTVANPQRIARIAMTLVRKTPHLEECTTESFAGALLTASALGLEPGLNDECYLVPYRDGRNKSGLRECTFILGYQGMIKLFWNHPRAKGLRTAAVYERDEFRYSKGLNEYLDHVPGPEPRGKLTHVYAIADLHEANPVWEVLTRAEVTALRNGKEGVDPKFAGHDPMDHMWRKEAIRQLFKFIPKSPRFALAIRAENTPPAEMMRDPQVIEATRAPDTPPVVHEGVIEDAPQQPDSWSQPDPDPVPVAGAELVTAAQQRMLHPLLKEHDLTDRGMALAYCAEVVGHPVDSTKDLTKVEASAVIASLQSGAGS